MRTRIYGLVILGLFCLAPNVLAQAPAAKAKLKPGVRVAIVGDSITEQKLYSRFMADYLTACYPQLEVHIVQFGWSGERAAGFLARMDNDLLPFKPDIVTLCYGMNDGEYTAFRPDIGQRYEKPLVEIVQKLKVSGATVVVGSPGCVDQYFFRKGKDEKTSSFAETYNANLSSLRDIAQKTATTAGMPFANVHDTMKQVMLSAQEKFGDRYHVCGADGFHPAPNGQLAMAVAFLSALDLDGDIGSIAIDLKGESSAKNGHKVIASKTGTVEIESNRYPFAFFGEQDSPNGTRSIANFLQFNDRFNRLTLKVTNANSDKLRVKWGNESKTFSQAQLEKGINLAAEFTDHPLVGAFVKVDQRIADQQNFQTIMIKSVITNHRALLALTQGDAEVARAAATIRDRLWAAEEKKHAAVRAALEPVKHTISVSAAE